MKRCKLKAIFLLFLPVKCFTVYIMIANSKKNVEDFFPKA